MHITTAAIKAEGGAMYTLDYNEQWEVIDDTPWSIMPTTKNYWVAYRVVQKVNQQLELTMSDWKCVSEIFRSIAKDMGDHSFKER
jgi:hypothetical protein